MLSWLLNVIGEHEYQPSGPSSFEKPSERGTRASRYRALPRQNNAGGDVIFVGPFYADRTICQCSTRACIEFSQTRQPCINLEPSWEYRAIQNRLLFACTSIGTDETRRRALPRPVQSQASRARAA